MKTTLHRASVRVLIAEDHADLRQGLKDILLDTPDISVAGEATHSLEVLNQLATRLWDAVVLDLSLPGAHGFDLLKKVRHLHPGLPVLVLGNYPEEQFAARTLRAGAAGYLLKDDAPEELAIAIREIYAGGTYFNPAITRSESTPRGTSGVATHPLPGCS